MIVFLVMALLVLVTQRFPVQDTWHDRREREAFRAQQERIKAHVQARL